MQEGVWAILLGREGGIVGVNVSSRFLTLAARRRSNPHLQHEKLASVGPFSAISPTLARLQVGDWTILLGRDGGTVGGDAPSRFLMPAARR